MGSLAVFLGGVLVMALVIATDHKPNGWRCYLGRHDPDEPKRGHVGLIQCRRCRTILEVYDWS